MLCIKKSVYLSIFALFAVLFGSCIITSKNVSALQDIIVTIDSSNIQSFQYCLDDVSSPCWGYNYAKFDFSSDEYLFYDSFFSFNFSCNLSPHIDNRNFNLQFSNSTIVSCLDGSSFSSISFLTRNHSNDFFE